MLVLKAQSIHTKTDKKRSGEQMNRRTKSDMFVLGYIAFELKKIGERLKVSGDVKKRINTSVTNIQKAYQEMLSKFTAEECLYLINSLKHNDLGVKAKTEKLVTKEPIDMLGNYVVVDEKGGALYDICDHALQFCYNCERKDVKKCVLKKAFETVGVPYFDEQEQCPYSMKR